MIKKGLLGVCVLLASASSLLATEQEDANALCVKSMTMAEDAKAKKGQRPDLSGICAINTRSPEFWQCVVDKQSSGNDFNYSTAQCDKLDPQ